MPVFPPVNFQRRQPSRARLAAGDIFTMQIPDGRYLFGRIVRTDANCFSPGCILVYVFRYLSHEQVPPPRVPVEALLIPPATINHLGWSRGYFVTVQRRSFEDGERLPVHYFEEVMRWNQRQFVDEDRKPLEHPPRGMLVGDAGLGNYGTIDDAVSRALGIPVLTDEGQPDGG